MLQHMSNPQAPLAIFLPALHGGGAERTMVNLANEIATRGRSVDLVVSQLVGPMQKEIAPQVRTIDLGAKSTLGSTRALIRYFNQVRPEAVLSALSRANLTAILARNFSKAPRRLFVCEQNTVSSWTQKSRNWRFRWVPAMAAILYRQSDGVIAVSQGVAEDLIQKCKVPSKKVIVIHNPVISPSMQQKAEEPLSHAWLSNNSDPVILSVGSLTLQKDYSTLIDAFAQLRRRRICKLLVLGEGSQREAIEKAILRHGLERDVSLPGFVSNPYPYMRRASVFALTSKWEGLPTVLIEALYCGLPVVSTDCPSGPREILQAGRFGRLVPVGDANAMAHALERAIDGDCPAPERLAWQKFTVQSICDQFLALMIGKDNTQSEREQIVTSPQSDLGNRAS